MNSGSEGVTPAARDARDRLSALARLVAAYRGAMHTRSNPKRATELDARLGAVIAEVLAADECGDAAVWGPLAGDWNAPTATPPS